MQRFLVSDLLPEFLRTVSLEIRDASSGLLIGAECLLTGCPPPAGGPVIEFPQIDYRGETPPYLQIATALLAAIESGELRPRQPIPSEKDLQDAAAVRNAVAWLCGHGFVYTVPQRGTYVLPPR